MLFKLICVICVIDLIILLVRVWVVYFKHGDNCKYLKNVINSGIDVYMSAGTKEKIGIKSHRIKTVIQFDTFKIGGFTILPFDVKHDCAEPLGYGVVIEVAKNGIYRILLDNRIS